jgi:hypothetical protein
MGIAVLVPHRPFKQQRKSKMSSQSIEFVKPPVNSSKDKKLTIMGAGLVIMGLLGFSQIPVTASGGPTTQGIDPTDSATLIWNAPTTSSPSYLLDVFEDNNGQRGTIITSVQMPAGLTSRKLRSYDTLRPPLMDGGFAEPLGAGSYFVDLRLSEGSSGSITGGPVLLTVPETSPSVSPSPSPTPPTSGFSAPPAPPVAIEMQVSLPATSLFAGNREFSLEAPNMSEVTEMTVNGRPLPIVGRNKKSLKIRVPFLRPGSYSVVVSTETESWIIPNAITIGELPANIKSEGLDESFLKFSSELPSQTKQEIRSLIEDTPDLKSVTVFAIAKREIIGEDRNKLARSRAASAYEFITRIDPEVVVRTEIIHYTEVELTSRGLFFKVTQKKQP